MTKKKTALCITAAAGILIAGAAFVNRKRLREYREKRQIIRIAQDYLQQKYGFQGDTRDVQTALGLHSVLFTDENQIREYRVYLDANMQPVLDTYQYDDVRKAINTRIHEAYPECERIELSVYSPERYIETMGDTARTVFGLDADTKFDGSNLDAVLKDCKLELTAYFTAADLADSPLTEQLEAWNTAGRFVAFDTAAHLSEYLQSDCFSRAASVPDDVFYAPYITQIREFDSESQSSTLTNYPLHEGDGFLYCCPAFPKVTCKKSEKQAEDAVSPGYWLDCAKDAAYVYYPIASLPDSESLFAVHGAYTEEERTTEPLIRCGDYAVIPLVGDMNPCWYLTKHADS